MKAHLICITLLTTGLAFAAEEHQIGKANRFALLLDRIADGKKQEDKKNQEDIQKVNKNSPFYVPTFDKDGNEILDRRRQPAVNLGGPSGWGVPAQPARQDAKPLMDYPIL